MKNNTLSVNRVEHKYIITPSQMLKLSRRLSDALYADENNLDGGYEIKSLYFDTPSNKDFMGKADGVFFHEKLRIRRYNEDYSYIKLENKRKYGDRQTKDSLLISPQEAKMLADFDFSFLLDKETDTALNFYRLFSKGYRPATIVKYTREAYYWPQKNIRITLDKQPMFCETNLDFFEKDLPYQYVFDTDTVILEVKYDGAMPGFLRNILGPLNYQRTSVSKYADSRKLLGKYF